MLEWVFNHTDEYLLMYNAYILAKNAVETGMLRILVLILNTYPRVIDDQLVADIARSGHLHIIQWALSPRNPVYNAIERFQGGAIPGIDGFLNILLKNVTENGHIHILAAMKEYIVGNNQVALIVWATYENRPEVIEWVLSEFPDTEILQFLLGTAASRGNVRILDLFASLIPPLYPKYPYPEYY